MFVLGVMNKDVKIEVAKDGYLVVTDDKGLICRYGPETMGQGKSNYLIVLNGGSIKIGKRLIAKIAQTWYCAN